MFDAVKTDGGLKVSGVPEYAYWMQSVKPPDGVHVVGAPSPMGTNAIAPAARTRMTLATPGLDSIIGAPEDPDAFDAWAPGNVSPLVAYLATADCPFNQTTFFVQGGTVQFFQPWTLTDKIEKDARWTVAELQAQMPTLEA